MKPKDKPLARKLTMVLVVKVVVLTVLWWGLLRDQRVPVNDEAAALHVLSAAPADHKE